MNNIELKLEVTEKLYDNLKTIAKENDISREHLSKEALERYVADNENVWASAVEQIRENEIIKKAQLREESEYKIMQIAGKRPAENREFLDLIIAEDTYYRLTVVAEKKAISVDQLVVGALSDFTDYYRELLEDKDKEKKEKKDKQKLQKLLQRQKKAKKKDREKQRRKQRRIKGRI
ncbi:hypothetical protein SAMN02745945_02087 [Peptoclostridium litorale DSM 5388]|uniref:Uncharacterized protein n=1 Tax=Peptoclostridium litorale DSM 5388 TaxID=1121324 RepID=A0A069RFA0_PEPLI|nr:hypothetical protein [Peptoclostridium litorale]KDR95468.1 hypothetical protein CLIT_10c01950 [Peptoclostridium litorale DSM 5388]SIO18062.1 hypothetical protein SAMN02745945_02087 [Peptoclostridium litorale DSM 5388]